MNKEQKALLKSNGFRCCNGKWYKQVKQYPFPLSALAVVEVSYHYRVVSKGYPFAPVTATELEGCRVCADLDKLEKKEND